MTLYVCERHHVTEADQKPPCCLAEHRPDIYLRVTCGAPILGPVATDGERLPPGHVEIDRRVYEVYCHTPVPLHTDEAVASLRAVPVEGEPDERPPTCDLRPGCTQEIDHDETPCDGYAWCPRCHGRGEISAWETGGEATGCGTCRDGCGMVPVEGEPEGATDG